MNERDAGLYPFTDDAIEYIEQHNMTIQELEENNFILKRAAERIQEALMFGIVSYNPGTPRVELMSFPVSVLFVRMIGERHLARRFAMAESERANTILEKDNENSLIKFAINNLGFGKIEIEIRDIDGEDKWLRIFFADYLKASKDLSRDPKWKLVNRLMIKGYVYITKHDLVRLMKERINQIIYTMVIERANVVLPPKSKRYFDTIFSLYQSVKPEITEFKEITEKKFPPCIKTMLYRLRASNNLSHAERFALGTFLLNIGMEREDAIDIWRVSPDWDESIATYQTEDLIKKNYKPPNCATMKTNGLCFAGDNKLCEKANHPLSYYAMSTWNPSKKKRRKV